MGVFGVNLYAERAGMVILTQDCDLLRSKELANRPKDRVFLETYRAALAELDRARKG